MRKKILAITLVSFTCMFTAGTALALSWAPSSLQVDFRNTALWNPTGGDGDIGSTTITRADITVNAVNGDISQYSMDGFGVYGARQGGLDEIDSNEQLHVDINGGMSLDGAWLSDLFQYNDDYNAAEWGTLLLNNGSANKKEIKFTAHNGSISGKAESVDNGEAFVAFDYQPLIYSIDFLPGYNPTIDANAAKNDYSVIGFASNPVPEPASMLLLGTGLIGLVGMRKKFTKG